MSSLQYKIPAIFTDATLPKLRMDPILFAGSLVLVDFNHPANPGGYIAAASGVPANGASVFNIANVEAAAVLGGGTAATLAGSLALGGAINNNVKGKIERTGKGGLHGIVSQANALASGDGLSLNVAAALRSYIAANTGHQFYVSAWDRITRAGTGGANTSMLHDLTAGATAAGFEFASVRSNAGGWNQAGGGIADSHNAGDSLTLASRYSAGRVTTASFASGAGASQFGAVWGAPTGSYNNAVLGSRNNTWASFAHYRFYLEDLTVSGRTFAQVDAIDFALYTTEVLTAGGRYNGDTFTAVATLP